MKNLKLTLYLLSLAAGLLLGACTEAKKETAPSPSAPPAFEVSTITVSSRPAPLTVELPGRTAAYRVAEVRPQVSGIVQKRLFTEGSEVKAGELLYQIDAATYQAALARAEAAQARSEAMEYSAPVK